jgi:hypothetical protein
MMTEGDKTFAAQVRDALCEVYAMRADHLLGRRRCAYTAQARMLGYYILRTWGLLSLPQIGEVFGRGHHTVMSGIDRTDRAMRVDPVLLGRLDRVLLLLQVPQGACPRFAVAIIQGRAVDYADLAHRHDGDLCAQPGCLAPRNMHGRRLRALPERVAA